MKERDNLDKLAFAVYGRTPTAREWLGGYNARILGDAADEIERLRKAVGTLASLLGRVYREIEPPGIKDRKEIAKALEEWKRIAGDSE